MKSFAIPLMLILCLPMILLAQKTVFTYPFEFKKNSITGADQNTCFLADSTEARFALVLHDNQKAEYMWLDKSFGILANFTLSVDKTIFSRGTKTFIGGTDSGGVFRFIYQNGFAKSFGMETVDFNKKSVTYQELLKMPTWERYLTSFCDNNTYYALATNDLFGKLIVYTMTGAGPLHRNVVDMPLDAMDKKFYKVSAYLSGITVFTSREEPAFFAAIKPVKLFSQPDKLTMVVNESGTDAHLYEVSTNDWTCSHLAMGFSSLTDVDSVRAFYVSSFPLGRRLYSMLWNGRDIRIVVHDIAGGNMLTHFEINREKGMELMTEPPVLEKRTGKKMVVKDLGDTRAMFEAFAAEAKGLMVAGDQQGRAVVTIGTYSRLPESYRPTIIRYAPGLTGMSLPGDYYSSGMLGSVAGGYGSSMTARPSDNMRTWQQTVPGNTEYREFRPPANARNFGDRDRYYSSTYCKILLDSNTLAVQKGAIPTSVTNQVKNYIDDLPGRAQPLHWFQLNNNYYCGYYNKQEKAYMVDRVRIFR